MLKKTLISLLSVLIIVTSLNMYSSNRNTAHAFIDGFYYSCSSYIESIERTRDYIRDELVPSYYQDLEYAKMYPSYEEKFLDLADRQQQHILNFLGHIFSDLQDLPYCNGIDQLSDDTIISLLQSIYELLTDPNMQSVFTTEHGAYQFRFDSMDYYKRVYSFLMIVDKIEKIGEENDRLNDLLNKVFGENPNSAELAFITVRSMLDTTKDTFSDLMTLRGDSLSDPNNPDYVTAALWLDRINMIYDLLSSEDQSNKKVSKHNESLLKSKAKGFVKGNLINAIARGISTELINASFGNNIPASEYEFLTDFASNMGAIFTASNRVGLGLVYMELNADLMAYVNSSLSEVWDSADAAYNEFMKQQQQQKVQFANELHHTATVLMEAKFKGTYSSDEFTDFYIHEINELENKLINIYDLSNSNIKIYLDGYMLKSDIAPFVHNGVTMVPLRLISESLDVTPVWNQQQKTITITTTRTKNWPNREVDIVLTVDSDIAKVHTRTTKLDAAPVIKNNTTFVPLRFIAESLSLDVQWYQDSKSIVLTTQ